MGDELRVDLKSYEQDTNDAPKADSTEPKEELSLFNVFEDWAGAHQTNIEELLTTYTSADDTFAKASAFIDGILADETLSDEQKAEYADRISNVIGGMDELIANAEQKYQDNRETIGVDFSIMQGKDASNPKDYQEQLKTFTQGEIDVKDTDGDGKISFDEFLAYELIGVEDEEQIKTVTEGARAVFDKMNAENNGLIDRFMNLINPNYDDKLTQGDLMRFYEKIDAIGADEEGNMIEAPKDGKINVDGYDAWIAAAMGI